LSSSLNVRTILRRLRPEKHQEALRRRSVSELPFLESASDLPRILLYDTTVYVDILQGHFPRVGEVAVRAADTWHSTVTEAELVAPCGSLNPDHPSTDQTIKQITAVIERRPPHRTIAPDREIWLIAGILSGMLARLQGYGRENRRRVLNDALIFATAHKYGMTVLTRNTDDFDFLQQLDPSGRVLFYGTPAGVA